MVGIGGMDGRRVYLATQRIMDNELHELYMSAFQL